MNKEQEQKIEKSAKIRTLRYRISDRIAGEENINSSIVDDILYEFQTELATILSEDAELKLVEEIKRIRDESKKYMDADFINKAKEKIEFNLCNELLQYQEGLKK